MKGEVLVIEDEVDVRKVLVRQLEHWGYEALATDDGQVALKLIEDNPPDLVLLDIAMPKMNGLEFLRSVKRLRPHLPVIVITGLIDDKLAEEALNLGAQDYIHKPVDSEELELRIHRRMAEIIQKA